MAAILGRSSEDWEINCIMCQLFYGCESRSRRLIQELPSDPQVAVIWSNNSRGLHNRPANRPSLMQEFHHGKRDLQHAVENRSFHLVGAKYRGETKRVGKILLPTKRYNRELFGTEIKHRFCLKYSETKQALNEYYFYEPISSPFLFRGSLCSLKVSVHNFVLHGEPSAKASHLT